MLTAEHIALRKRSVGASDVAAICGVAAPGGRTAWDVWARLTDKLVDPSRADGSGSGNEAIELGNALEDMLVGWAGERLGCEVLRNVIVEGEPDRFSFPTHAQCDGVALAEDDRAPVEAKTAGLAGPFMNAGEWGEEGSGEIPEAYLVQATWQAHILGAHMTHVPAMLGGRGRVLYRVDYNGRLAEMLMERVERFWVKNVKADTPPENVMPSYDTLKSYRRQVGKLIALTAGMADTVAALNRAKETEQQAREDRERAEKALLVQLGDAEGTEDGLVAYTLARRSGYIVPDTEYRVLRVKGLARKRKTGSNAVAVKTEGEGQEL